MRSIRYLGALWLLVPACASAQRDRPLSRHVGIVPEQGGHPLVMAVGDGLQLLAHRYRCHYDVCEIEETRLQPQWIVTSAAITISPTGLVRAQRPGQYPIRVRLGGRSGNDTIRVLPPVKDLAWTRHPSRLYVGDTLRIAVLARDSLGRVLGQLTLAEHDGGTGRSGEVVSYADRGFTVLYIDRPGTVQLVARMAHRTDTLRIDAVVRPR